MSCTQAMRTTTFLIFLLCFILVVGRPPLEYKDKDAPAPAVAVGNPVMFAIPGLEELEYGRYIQEVVNELEQDPNFRRLIESDNYTQAEDIAAQLAMLSHSVRTRLDELKRREVDRLVALQRLLVTFNETKKYKDKKNQVLRDLLRVKMHHIDIQNPDKFGEADLVRLIRQTATDLEALDEVRRQQFKRYEMQKAYERLKAYKNELPRNSTANKIADAKLPTPAAGPNTALDQKVFTRNASGVHINYPGRRAHLTDVWKNVDGQEDAFHSRTFFALHDTNTDGHWDFNEVNALMRRELDKLYPPSNADVQNPGSPLEGDANERYEEMNRLREVFFEQIDSNNDALVSLAEFFVWSASPEFNDDDVVWKTIAEAPPTFTSTEFEEFMHNQGRAGDQALPAPVQGVL